MSNQERKIPLNKNLSVDPERSRRLEVDSNSQGLAHKQKSNQERKDQKGFDSTDGDDEQKNEKDLEKTPVYDESGKKL